MNYDSFGNRVDLRLSLATGLDCSTANFDCTCIEIVFETVLLIGSHAKLFDEAVHLKKK